MTRRPGPFSFHDRYFRHLQADQLLVVAEVHLAVRPAPGAPRLLALTTLLRASSLYSFGSGSNSIRSPRSSSISSLSSPSAAARRGTCRPSVRPQHLAGLRLDAVQRRRRRERHRARHDVDVLLADRDRRREVAGQLRVLPHLRRRCLPSLLLELQADPAVGDRAAPAAGRRPRTGVVELSLSLSTSGNSQSFLPSVGARPRRPCCVRNTTCRSLPSPSAMPRGVAGAVVEALPDHLALVLREGDDRRALAADVDQHLVALDQRRAGDAEEQVRRR